MGFRKWFTTVVTINFIIFLNLGIGYARLIPSGNENVFSLGKDKDGSEHWIYDWPGNDGLVPDEWSAINGSRCNGQRQSPIALDLANKQINSNLTRLVLVDYDDSPINESWSITNNGHSVEMSATFYTPPQLHSGGLPGKFVFQRMHFHWGGNSSVGSEHAIDNKRFPLEIHLVHKMKNNSDSEAQSNSVGLAVIGVMFEIGNSTDTPDPFVANLAKAIASVVEPGTTENVRLPMLSLSELVPANQSYLRYLGSLTTPPCSEAVVWTVMTTPLKITEEQIALLRTMHSGKRTDMNQTEQFLIDNFRPLQEANDRLVAFYADHNAGSSLRCVYWVAFSVFLATIV